MFRRKDSCRLAELGVTDVLGLAGLAAGSHHEAIHMHFETTPAVGIADGQGRTVHTQCYRLTNEHDTDCTLNDMVNATIDAILGCKDTTFPRLWKNYLAGLEFLCIFAP